MKATRDAFGETLKRLGKEFDEIVVLDADLSESTRSSKFAHEYPNRFFQLGIQEANMIGTAAGLAACGKVAFCCSFSCFVTSRFDQIKVSVAYNDLRVTIVGSHAGCGVGPDGYTQMALEDVAMLRTLPNMAVFQPADDIEAERMVEYLVRSHTGPAFLRLTRQKVRRVHDDAYQFCPGKPDLLRCCDDAKLTICATGACVESALDAAEKLTETGVPTAVFNIPSIAPLDIQPIIDVAGHSQLIMTAEDHSVIGGMGSAICEALSEKQPMRVHRVGLREFGESGSTEDLFAKHHLDAEGLIQEARANLL